MKQLLRRLVGRSPWPDFRRLPVVNDALAAHGLPPLTPEPGQPDPVRLALAERLTGRRRLTDPRFADWLAARHPRRAAELRAACATGAGSAGRVYESRPDIRVALPFGLTLQQRPGLLAWMLGGGHAEVGFTPEQAVWAVVESSERDDGLAALYRWNPDWQAAVPDGLSPAGWPRLVAHLTALGLDPRAAGRRPPDDGPADLLVLSYFRNPCGLQVEADAIADGLAAAGWRIRRRTLPGEPAPGRADPRAFADLENAPVTLAKLGAAEGLADVYRRAGLHPRPGVYRVANLSWELDRFPPAAADRLALADEVWTPSRFCADAARAELPDKPVRAMPPGVTAPPVGRFDRAHYGLADGRFVALFVFDLGSVAARKNPLGLVRAFRRAFPASEPVTLCLKVSNGRHFPAAVAELRAAEPDVVVLDRVMTRPEVGGLMAAVEPWHGNTVVLYTPLAQRTVLDDKLRWGHAIKLADLDGDGKPEVIAGVRDDPAKGDTFTDRRGVRVYRSTDDWKTWTRHPIDPGGVAVEDLAVADLDGDGRLDLVAVGRQTKNLKVYWSREP